MCMENPVSILHSDLHRYHNRIVEANSHRKIELENWDPLDSNCRTSHVSSTTSHFIDGQHAFRCCGEMQVVLPSPRWFRILCSRAARLHLEFSHPPYSKRYCRSIEKLVSRFLLFNDLRC